MEKETETRRTYNHTSTVAQNNECELSINDRFSSYTTEDNSSVLTLKKIDNDINSSIKTTERCTFNLGNGKDTVENVLHVKGLKDNPLCTKN